ncbi:hypothetical protein Q5P01_001025 [Channa striata]|uniref:Uncharacterized protein n=1 Tax=Channa striata TaxID=64152 RepID=A0AA88IIP2_CHASR|nr:hypothetical protein Q5P01_001025 [Channa striata]
MHDSPSGAARAEPRESAGSGLPPETRARDGRPEPCATWQLGDGGCCPAPGAARGLRAHPEDHGEPRSDQRRSTTCTGRRQRLRFTWPSWGAQQRERRPPRVRNASDTAKRREETPTEPPSQKKKRKRRARPAAGGRSRGDAREPKNGSRSAWRRMAKAHANGAAPGQPRRFLRLSRSGDMFLRRKRQSRRDERVRASGAVHGASRDRLQRDAVGLGIKRLLTGAWRTEIFFAVVRAAREIAGAPPDGTREEAREPPTFTAWPWRRRLHWDTAKIRDKHWTGAKCE